MEENTRLWHQDAVFYHIYTFGLCGAPFRNEDSAIVQRMEEVESWIPHIRDLGVDAVIFSPVFQSLTHGYDTTDYRRIDNRIGDNESFARLVGRFHEAGIRVVLDAVFNHCGRNFFAFQDIQRRREDSPYRGWIAGLDFGRDNGFHDGFAYETWSGYEELVKYNLKNPEVAAYLLDTADFWIETFDVDGLRLDAANVLDFDFMRRLRQRTTKRKPDFWLMGEVVHGDYNVWANPETLHSVTNYELYKGLYSSHNERNLFELAHTLKREFGDGGIYRQQRLYNFADNHDQDRLANLVEQPAYLYTIYLVLFTAPGLPALYYGSEWGKRGQRKNGSDAEIRPYIDLKDADKEMPELEEFLKKLIAVRKASEALQYGDYREVFIAWQKPFLFERRLTEQWVVIAINPMEQAETIDLSVYGCPLRDLLTDEEFEEDRCAAIPMPPYGGRILQAR
jgi:glycosidase